MSRVKEATRKADRCEFLDMLTDLTVFVVCVVVSGKWWNFLCLGFFICVRRNSKLVRE